MSATTVLPTIANQRASASNPPMKIRHVISEVNSIDSNTAGPSGITSFIIKSQADVILNTKDMYMSFLCTLPTAMTLDGNAETLVESATLMCGSQILSETTNYASTSRLLYSTGTDPGSESSLQIMQNGFGTTDLDDLTVHSALAVKIAKRYVVSFNEMNILNGGTGTLPTCIMGDLILNIRWRSIAAQAIMGASGSTPTFEISGCKLFVPEMHMPDDYIQKLIHQLATPEGVYLQYSEWYNSCIPVSAIASSSTHVLSGATDIQSIFMGLRRNEDMLPERQYTTITRQSNLIRAQWNINSTRYPAVPITIEPTEQGAVVDAYMQTCYAAGKENQLCGVGTNFHPLKYGYESDY